MAPSFVHLRLHTEYSLVDSLVRIRPLIQATSEAGMPAVAVTDQSNVFAMIKFYRAAQAAGVKPIIGADIFLVGSGEHSRVSRFTLLCQNELGYRNLSSLLSRAYREGQYQGIPRLQWDWLQNLNDGLIILSGGREGDVGQALLAGNDIQAGKLLERWQALFPGRYYLELHRTGREGEEDYLHAAIALALARDTPVVATNDVRFLRPQDFEAHEARVCIHEGRTLNDPRRPRHYSEQQYLRTPSEMTELFADLPEALENTVEIARRCNLELTLGKHYLPNFPVPEDLSIEAFLAAEARRGLEQRLVKLYPREAKRETEQPAYEARLAEELAVINQMGFPGYFLIVADFIRWAKKNGIPVGPGRGSGAGSLVAYALQITDLDPLAFDLLFERFLNPERVSLPDFDIDFCMERRDRVIDYVSHYYGRDHVSQIITYGSMAAKAVVRDVGRVLGHPYGFVDQIAKLIPFDLKMTLDKALAESEGLRSRYEGEEEVRFLIDLARKLEGLIRNAGKHAGGVVIAPKKLTEYVPYYCEQGASGVVTQFDKDDIETIGLVKFDFLGLRTLTILDWALQAINRQRTQQGEALLDLALLPMDDPKSYALLKRCATTAVFQLESRGMKDLIKRLQPDCFEDIIALVALFRPGPLQSGMVDDYINRKHGRAQVNYPHPALEPILKPTYGVIVYQEQVMQIAQVLAGYTLGEADLLRRAMGKKKPEEMAEQRAIFTAGAKAREVDEKTATAIFDLMEKFAEYGFNKSHSAAYAVIAYQTAYLKAHYPASYMAAVLSADMDNTEKVKAFVEECWAMNLDLLPPDVNASNYSFSAQGETAIRYGLGAIKGVGAAALEGIIKVRERHGPYQDLFEFCRRIDLRKVSRRVLEALIRAGALDSLGVERATLEASLETALALAEQHCRNASLGQNDLFGLDLVSEEGEAGNYVEVREWDKEQRLALEKETLGLYLSGHPIDCYKQELKQIAPCRIVELIDRANNRQSRNQQIVIAGLVGSVRTNKARQGGRNAFVTLEDGSARLEIKAFAEVFDKYRERLQLDHIVVIEGALKWDSYADSTAVTAEKIYSIAEAQEVFAKSLEIGLDGTRMGQEVIAELAQILAPFRQGRCPVAIDYRNRIASARLILGEEWQVRPNEVLLARLRLLPGAEHVRISY
ncbi:DNA polymerase III, alpha subunit [Nitrosococcus oceani ATCC 19707]|uniref:DNA polymerase III subunit alpha n=2 Tax=Nitrosococcus oceani TaxID=1229 RepID=Q3JCT7_NITOC|nr:DNA polymerase III subunit alpha [Nitrosococcus oceani]ABA57359.1 DNA polymerase III, alpha subunit [Nitrosococcus oceani ATCC 19707]EDZ67042.1 DNA polymerase III, alpha subunit subfamily, putative [Nitrosococcus oceani AFC27]KFI20336.1 DNA polymerase III subunit alpha [Nitrosococcus oceani C-27]GEM20235.1 DNA polymerase III subunit alpha [Nitrosococcus oceani]